MLLPTFIIGKELQNGRLQSVLSEYIPLERYIYAVYLPNHHLSAKVRAFIDYLLRRFGPEPYWDRNWPRHELFATREEKIVVGVGHVARRTRCTSVLHDERSRISTLNAREPDGLRPDRARHR